MDAEPPQGLGFPGRGPVPDPGQSCHVAVDPADEVGERAARGVGGSDALAEVATGPRLTGLGVVADAGKQVAWHAEHATPVVCEADVAQCVDPTPGVPAAIGSVATT